MCLEFPEESGHPDILVLIALVILDAMNREKITPLATLASVVQETSGAKTPPLAFNCTVYLVFGRRPEIVYGDVYMTFWIGESVDDVGLYSMTYDAALATGVQATVALEAVRLVHEMEAGLGKSVVHITAEPNSPPVAFTFTE
jgi:hypothetical protein